MSTLDLAVIGNSIFSCLLDSKGKLVWSCFPKMDSDPVFNCLLNNNSSYSVSLYVIQGFFDFELDGFDHST
jgi:hypothetical protein